MSDNKNPYKRGNYVKAFAFWRKRQIVTLKQLVEFFMGEGLKEDAARSSATVILSPRETAREGCDCRGNYSAQGHLYFADPLAKAKAGDELRFRLRYRKVALDRRVRPPVSKVDQKTSRKARKPAKAKTAAAVA